MKYKFNKSKSGEIYFIEQFKKPKFSTINFFEILKSKGLNNLKTVDLACGNGANLFCLKKLFSNYKECLGLDFNKNLINFAKKNNIFSELNFECSNILKIPKKYYNKFELAISLQTLSWLNDYEKAALEMIKMNPKYIALSSLFWEGLIDFNIKLNCLKNQSHKRKIDTYTFYNIYSLNNFLNFFKKYNYKKIILKKFIINRNLPKPKKLYSMGTYTIKDKKNLIQISGPIVMNWYFIIFEKV